MSCFPFCLAALLAPLLCGVRVQKKKKPQPNTEQLGRLIALDLRVDPTDEPTSELVIYAVSAL